MLCHPALRIVDRLDRMSFVLDDRRI